MVEINASLGESKSNRNPVVSLTVEIGGELKTIKGRDARALAELILISIEKRRTARGRLRRHPPAMCSGDRVVAVQRQGEKARARS